jgi:hypothetical protein
VQLDEVVQPGETVFEDVSALVRGGLAGVRALGEPAQRTGGGVTEPGEVDKVGASSWLCAALAIGRVVLLGRGGVAGLDLAGVGFAAGSRRPTGWRSP